ncbi:MAG: transcriptional repressor LexA [Elusimicrobia bacterium]|nr:transcriptional repressor LexA [Elusimicrobiota bacterium]
MTREITKRQKDILMFIADQVNSAGIPPTIREIMANFNFTSMRSAQDHLKALSKKGYIRLKGSLSRGIELLISPYSIPILGEISAGKPLEAIENIEGYLDLVNVFTKRAPLFSLRVKGDSMEGAGIFEGDMVIVRKQPSADPGQIVAALIEGEALVKRLKKKSGGLVLASENPKYEDIRLDRETRVIGKVVGVLRDYGK